MLARVRQPALKQPAKDANRARHIWPQEARRLRRRRSRSDSPPQIPNRSSLASAYSRHSVWTVQVWQMRLAARVEPPFSGKKQSASLSRQAACSYQGWISTGMGPIQCLLNRCSEASGSHAYGSLEHHDRNYIGGILRLLEWLFQAEGFFCGQVAEARTSRRSGRWPVHGIASRRTEELAGGFVLGFGGEREAVSKVGLTAADLVAARLREPAAVSRIYTAYAPALFRFFMASVGDRHLAEDLTGNTFVSAIEGLPRFRGPVEALGGWLFQIARHDLYDFRRKQGRSRTEPLEENLTEATAATGGDDPEDLAIERLEGSRVLAAMRQLSDDQREVLLLRMAGGLTAPEVAAVVGKTTGAVKALQHRGLASLSRVLGLRSPDETQERPYPSPDPGRLTSQEDEER